MVSGRGGSLTATPTSRPKRAGAGLAFAVALLAATAALAGQREPVLKQIDLPHDYYWREQYLPQLTTGPSSLAWTPDSKALIYSMAGSLWRQPLGSDEAVELTHARGAYDDQPDVTPDGRAVVFTRYDGAAMELWRLDLASGRETKLTSGGAVNVEPRVSPDGKRLAYVSTQGTGHFNLFVTDLAADGALANAAALSRRAAQQDRSLLLFGVRSRHQSGVVAGRVANLLYRQSRGRLGDRRHLVGLQPRSRRPARRCSPRRRCGARGRNPRRTASVSSSQAITAGNGASCGSRRPPAPRRCR